MPETSSDAESRTAIEIQHLSKHFGTLKAVDDVSFNILKNEIFGLLGPNGAGKTTTINLICGLLPSTGGSVQFSGFPAFDPKSLIGYCPQENIFYPRLTCFEQLMFTGSIYGLTSGKARSRALELLELMGLMEKSDKRASGLSGGMKRRLNICLALIHDPEILVLDEPEAGLDPQSRMLVRDFIRAFGSNKTIILTTHNMDEADRLADRIAIMDHGRILLLDSPSNLKKSVGDGDILEIVTENGNADRVEKFKAYMGNHFPDIKSEGNCITIRHRGIIDHIADIRNAADNNQLSISEIRLRENTLEDVFIKLTGRTLRQ